MKILVTGATGFIGARLVEDLLDQHEIVFTGRKEPRDRSLIERGARFLPGDLTDAQYAQRVCEGCEAIVHCAGLAGTWGPYEVYYQANVVATENLLKGARTAGVRRFVNISSPSIYFDFKHQFDLREDYVPPKFSNAYAETKWLAEKLVREYHSPPLQTVSLRPRAVIGRGDVNIFPRLLKLQQTGSLVQIGREDHRVDLTTIGNLLDAVVLCLTAPSEAMGETYNITNGQPVEFWKTVDHVLELARLPTARRHVPYAPVMAAAWVNERVSRMLGVKKEPMLLPITVGVMCFSMTMDISKAREKLSYRPRFTLEDGVQEFMRSWRG